MGWAAIHSSEWNRKTNEERFTATHETVMKNIEDFETFVFGKEFQKDLSETRQRVDSKEGSSS